MRYLTGILNKYTHTKAFLFGICPKVNYAQRNIMRNGINMFEVFFLFVYITKLRKVLLVTFYLVGIEIDRWPGSFYLQWIMKKDEAKEMLFYVEGDEKHTIHLFQPNKNVSNVLKFHGDEYIFFGLFSTKFSSNFIYTMGIDISKQMLCNKMRDLFLCFFLAYFRFVCNIFLFLL